MKPRQFGTGAIWYQGENLALRQFGTGGKFGNRTTRKQDNLAPGTIKRQNNLATGDNLAPGQFGTGGNLAPRQLGNRRQFGTGGKFGNRTKRKQDNLAPGTI